MSGQKLNHFNLDILFSIPLLVAIATVVLLNGLFAFLLIYAMKRKFNKTLHGIESQMQMLTAGSLGVGKKIIDLEARFKQLKSEQKDYQNSDLDYSFTQAQKLIEQGVDRSAIAANSGLSTSEIQLMELLYGKNKNNVNIHA